jgi:ATP-dependent protease ClpP protease subunit
LYDFKLTDRADVAEFHICEHVRDWNNGPPTTTSEKATLDAIAARLDSCPPHVTTMELRINCAGGLMHVAGGICDLLSRSRFSVITSIENLALSAGAVVSQAGKVRRMAEDGLWMIHPSTMPIDLSQFPGGLFIFHEEGLREYADLLHRSTEQSVRICAERSGRTAADIQKLFRQHLTAEEAKSENLIDEIIPARPPLGGDLRPGMGFPASAKSTWLKAGEGAADNRSNDDRARDNLARYLRGTNSRIKCPIYFVADRPFAVKGNTAPHKVATQVGDSRTACALFMNRTMAEEVSRGLRQCQGGTWTVATLPDEAAVRRLVKVMRIDHPDWGFTLDARSRLAEFVERLRIYVHSEILEMLTA